MWTEAFEPLQMRLMNGKTKKVMIEVFCQGIFGINL